MRLFMTGDKKAGFALKGDDIVSVFKHPDSTAKNAASVMLDLAVQQGGRRLDCFDTQLPYIYGAHGFKSVGRVKFDPQYQPEGWNASKFGAFNKGQPDVVFMVYDPQNAEKYKPGDGSYVTEYDEGAKRQEAALKGDQSTAASDLLSESQRHVDVAKVIASVPNAQHQIDRARALLSQSVPTDAEVSQGGFKEKDGSWTPEREKLHEHILAKVFSREAIAAATPKDNARPVASLMGGRGGSGKSWFTSSGLVDSKSAIYLNSDDFKEALPEYQGWNAALLHEEASHILVMAEHLARDHGLNVIVDGTMRTSKQTEARTSLYKSAGYEVRGYYMHVPPEEAAKRALERFVRGGERGRYVPPEYAAGSVTNEQSFDKAKEHMDHWEVYDNSTRAESGRQEPRLVARKKKS
jgi:predicted ABC-type ATPase